MTFTIHATRKLLDRVKAPVLDPVDASGVLGNWYATAVFWKPRVLVNLSVILARTPMSPLYSRHVSPDRELAAVVEQALT